MKTLKIFVSFCIIFLFIIIGSCKGPINQIDETYGDAELKKGTPKNSATLEDQQIIDGILHMREDEKLAHDVYVKFYELYGQSIFLNISESEKRHSEAIVRLIDYYKLNDPEKETADGIFNNTDFQEIYDRMISDGEAGLIPALNVGVEIELLDIEDISLLMEDLEVKNILQVYSNLLNGSENHLKSFEKALDQLDKKLNK